MQECIYLEEEKLPTDIVSEPLRFTFLLEIGEKICLSVLFQPVSGTVFKKRLLTFKTYLLGECQSVFILYPFLLVSRMKPDIEIQIFFSAVMLDLEFWFSCHRPGGIEYLISVLVKHRGFSLITVFSSHYFFTNTFILCSANLSRFS